MKRPLPTACWLLSLCIAATAPGQARQPQPQPTTQKATISLTAFEPNDPDVTPELAAAVTTKMVTTKFQNLAPLDAMKELAKVTGYEIRPAYENWFQDRRQRGTNVTFDVNNQPFWSVIREISTRGNIGIYNSGGDETKVVQLAPANYGPANMRAATSIRGPFMVVVGHLQRINTVDMASPQNTNRVINIQIQTWVEPKLTVSRVGYQGVVTEAVDENGNSMVPPNQDTEGRNTSGNRGISYHGNIALNYPTTNPGKTIVKLKGYIPAVLNLSSQPIEITDPLKAEEQTKTIGAREVTIKKLQKTGTGNYSISLVFKRGKDDTQPMHEMFQEAIPIKLTNAQGLAYRQYNGGGNGGEDTITRTFSFQPPRGRTTAEAGAAGDPTKLVIEIPSKREEIGIPFELVNLPLP